MRPGAKAVLDEFVKDYLIECREGLAGIEADLLALEREPGSRAILATIFRAVHSIKGSSGFLGFAKMAAVTHEGEELLGLLRDGAIATTPAVVSGLLALVDAMRSILGAIEADRAEGDRDDSALIARLAALRRGEAPEPGPAEVEPLEPKAEAVEPAAAPGSASGDSTIRVDVALLDALMNLVGELVLTRNQFLRGSMARDEALFQASTQRLDQITTGLQEGMMKTRMQPIRSLTAPLPRVVRDLALACGKRAEFVMEGEETELDRTLGEAIKDPITHIIRNAVDHGIEAPEERLALGKPASGTVRMRAYHEGGLVRVEVSDDGRGIDPERIRRKAVERGWIDADRAASWSDRDLIALIFRPGFSTAESTTLVSGRGVGMDVVKGRIESIGGGVDASSRPGEGTTIKIHVPLTLTIINALIVEAGGDRFAIPQVNLIELIRLGPGPASGRLIEVQGALVCRHRGAVLPVIDLNEALGFGRGSGRDGDGAANLVVLQADRRRFGLIVDRIDDAREIVVRPLSRRLRGITRLAGATVMSDGAIALILDVFGLAEGLGSYREPDPEPRPAADPDPEAVETGPVEALVVLHGDDGGPMAVPLADVERLEMVPRSSVERLAGRPVLAYRKTLIPLIDVAATLRGEAWPDHVPTGTDPARPHHVVIHTHEGRRVGLVFDRVIDVVEARLDVVGEPSRPYVRSTAVVRGVATEVLDVAALRAGA